MTVNPEAYSTAKKEARRYDELAEWCYRITTDAMSILQIGNNRQTQSCLGWLDWLKQEAAE